MRKNDLENNEKENKFKLINKSWINLILALSIPILYIQGFAFYEGLLYPYNISESLYPISFEQALIFSGMFYINAIKYIIAFAVIWFLFFYLFGKFSNWVNTFKFFSGMNSNPEKAHKKLDDFYQSHKEAVVGTGVLLGLVYVSLVLGILIAAPFYLGLYQSNQKIGNSNENIQGDSVLSTQVKLYLKGKEIPIIGNMTMRSENMITIYNKEVLSTYPMSEVHSITHDVMN